ncbi:MAG: hypothetical protein II971_02275 [Firmicutes bacterium]|nr:hypothetical protein [Bacillota bacterium]
MRAFPLKIIAMLTMTIDHTGAVFFAYQNIWRIIGRIAMPLYSLMMADACRHVARKEGGLRRYVIFLGTVALASELFYDYALEGAAVSLDSQNQVLQFFTFALAFALCRKLPSGPPRAAVWIAVIVLNNVTRMGYYGAGIVLPLMFCAYLDRYKEHGLGWRLCMNTLIMFAFICVQFAEIALRYRGADHIVREIIFRLAADKINRGVFLAVPLLSLYNGKYGYPPDWFKTLYKYYYTLHLAVLSLLLLMSGRGA